MQKKHNDILVDDSINTANQLLEEILNSFVADNYKNIIKKLSSAHKIFLANKKITEVSICLSLTGLIKYITKEESYYKSLLLLEDSKFLAESTNQKVALAVNKFAFGYIYFIENKYNEALFYITYASENLNNIPTLKIKAMETLSHIYTKIRDFKSSNKYLDAAISLAENSQNFRTAERLKKYSENYNSNLSEYKNLEESEQNTTLIIALSKIARTVSAETNLDNILGTITEQTKIVLNADRCTIFLLDKPKNQLWSKVALGMNKEEIRFSADKGFAGHVVKTGETINIKDAYKDSRFNSDIDKHTGYTTYNLLCMPIRNIKFEIIGVFEVLNKKNGSFTEEDEELLFAIGTNAGIAIENNILFRIQLKMLNEQKTLFEGFINTLAASIDARDKITLGHSNRVRWYSELIANQLGLNKDVTEIISRAAILHDIGKIGIRDSVLQKKGSLTKEEYDHIKEHVKITYDILCKTNLNSSFAEIAEIASSHHEKFDGSGYFRGLKGNEIPLGGRILAVSDVFDAITSVRHYRDRMPMEQVLKIIIEGKNKHFDANIVDAFLSLPCDVVTEVLISEFNTELKAGDKKILSTLNLQKFADILQKENPTPEEKKITDIFSSYYICKKETVNS